MAWSVSSSTRRPTRAVAIVTRKRVARSSNTDAASPGDELAKGGGGLRSGWEVEGFQVVPRHGLLVEALAPRARSLTAKQA